MVTRDTAWPDGTPCWVDLGVADIARADAFYAGLFGWDIQPGPPEAGGYTMCPPWDTPYGRMAVVTDDQGAEFSVITQPGS